MSLQAFETWTPGKGGAKDIQTAMESGPLHQGQEAPERCTLAPWRMPFGIIIVGGDHGVACSAVHVSQPTHWE